MIYAVGTGRCGTKSYADQNGGLHEPDKYFSPLAISYYQTGVATPQLLDMIKLRAKAKGKCVSDNKQSYCMDLIKAADPEAYFVWLIRNPQSCITSHMRRGKYEDILRPVPKNGWPWGFDDFKKFCWLWKASNLLIEENIIGNPFEVVRTRTLTVKANKGRSNPIAWTDEMESYFAEEVDPYWQYLHERYDPLRSEL